MLNIFANTTNGHNPLRNLRPPLDQILDISSATESAKPILVDVAMLYGAYLTYDLVLYALDDAVRDVTTLLNFHGHNAWNDVMVCMFLRSIGPKHHAFVAGNNECLPRGDAQNHHVSAS